MTRTLRRLALAAAAALACGAAGAASAGATPTATPTATAVAVAVSPSFTDQAGCAAGSYTIPDAPGVDYYLNGRPEPAPAGTHPVALNNSFHAHLVAHDHLTGATTGVYDHAFGPGDAPCYRIQDIDFIGTSSGCGAGDAVFTVTVGPHGFSTHLSVTSALPGGVPELVHQMLAQRGQTVVYRYRPAQPAGRTVRLFIDEPNVLDGQADLAVLVLDTDCPSQAAPTPSRPSASRHATPARPPAAQQPAAGLSPARRAAGSTPAPRAAALANTGPAHPGALAAVAVALILLGAALTFLMPAGGARRRAATDGKTLPSASPQPSRGVMSR